MSISVVVPFRNAERYVGQLLRSLVCQLVTETTEIIVVNNGPPEDWRCAAPSAAGSLPVRIIGARERTGAAYARNVGARMASGDKLIFVDADDEVAPGYIEAMSAALNRLDFVTSRVDSEALNDSWVRSAHGRPWQVDGVMTFFDFLPAAGVNVGISRALFERLGGFPEEFPASEDIALSWKAQLAGVRIHFVPDAVYRYRYRTTLAGLFRQSCSWGSSNVLLYRTFRTCGMPARTFTCFRRDWSAVLRLLWQTRTKQDVATTLVRIGYCVGRLWGSFRYRTAYF